VEEEFGFIAFCSYGVAVDSGKERFMADQTHLDVLLQDVEAWNEWREQNPSIRPDLSEADLTGADLTGANLSRADLTNAYLSSGTPYIYPYNAANLTGADLTGANLFSVSLFEVNLKGADLTGAKLTEASLWQAKLTEANLSGVDLTDVNLKWTRLYGADLSRTTNLTQKQIEEAFGDEQTKLPERLKRPADWSRGSDEPPNIDE
jgi:uncharacterized protein YjbI with pentapeptide repeats